jgi:hypothetical protein
MILLLAKSKEQRAKSKEQRAKKEAGDVAASPAYAGGVGGFGSR